MAHTFQALPGRIRRRLEPGLSNEHHKSFEDMLSSTGITTISYYNDRAGLGIHKNLNFGLGNNSANWRKTVTKKSQIAVIHADIIPP